MSARAIRLDRVYVLGFYFAAFLFVILRAVMRAPMT